MTMSMKVAVLGAGAMGSLFGGLLAEQGLAVQLLDVNPAHIAAVQAEGLRLETDRGDRRVAVPICRPEEARETPDWLLVFTKTGDTARALASAAHLLGPQTRVLSLQNGLGGADRLAEWVPAGRIAIGVTTVPSDLAGPGHVRSHGAGSIRLMMAQGQDDAMLRQLAEALGTAGLPAEVDPTVGVAIWEKVAFNAAFNALCASSGCRVGALAALPEARALAFEVADEVLQVARASGVAVQPGRVHATMAHALEHHGAHQPSMLQDLLAGRRTEIDAINGAVVRAAEALGQPVPRNRTLATLVRLIEGRTLAATSGA